MELTQQVSGLQEELKLLKGEIKAVLKEIRTAVLNNDNPFSADTSLLSATPAAVVPQATPAEPPAPSPDPVPQAQEPPPPRHEAPSPQSSAPLNRYADDGAIPITREWNLMTVAGLMLWAEEAAATLGTERLRMVLELASAAELLPADTREVLARIARVTPKRETADDKISVIDCVMVLHQLEAILHGDGEPRLPLRRDSYLRRVS